MIDLFSFDETLDNGVSDVRKVIYIYTPLEWPVKLLLTSSVGVATGWSERKGPVPETTLDDLDFAALSGIDYSLREDDVGQIVHAAVVRGLEANVIRIGQACGTRVTGAWETSEWFPIMVKSSDALGCLPLMPEPVAWVPLDAIAHAYADWVCADSQLPGVMNVVHPRPTSWDVILRGVSEELGQMLPVVPLHDWVAKLETHMNDATSEALVAIPALKLMGFFRRLVNAGESATSSRLASDADPGVSLGRTFDASELERSSPTMHELQPLSDAHARVRFWKDCAFI